MRGGRSTGLTAGCCKGETIPHGEKVFSIFEEHTRWCSKGKLGQAVELGVPVAIVESRQQYVLHWQVL